MPLNNPVGSPTSQGNYIGNDTANRAIPHGLNRVPKIVSLFGGVYQHTIYGGVAIITYVDNAASGYKAVTAPDSTYFYVGNAASYQQSANRGAGGPDTIQWVAIG